MPRKEETFSGVGHLLYEIFRRRKGREEKEEKEKKQKKDPMIELYKKYCTKKGKASKEIKEAIAVLGWDVDPRCVPTVAVFMAEVAFLGMIVLFPFYLAYQVLFQGLPIDQLFAYIVYGLTSGDFMLWSFLIMPFIVAFSVWLYFYYYPVWKRDQLLKDMLPTLPETIGYLVLSMKLTPNLEKALEFAGENGTGRLAEEFKKLVWEIRMGLHTSTEEAIDKLAYRWGKFLREIKHALMRIRGAVLEPDDARRNIRLDEALKEVMTSVKERISELASKMYMPSVQLFYLGVFLPLLLFIIFPVAAAFTDIPIASLPVLVFVYVFFLPLVTYAFAKSILSRRPSIYEPPVPPKDLIKERRKLQRRAIIVAISLFLAFVFLGYYLHTSLDYTYEKIETIYCGAPGCLLSKYGYTSWDEAVKDPNIQYILSSFDTTPYWIVFGIFLGIVSALGAYLYITEKPRVELERRFEEMEEEFRDTVYLLASRMGEGKPLEGALDSLMEFMPDATIVQEVFSKISYNVKVLGLSLHDAVFDPVFGALKDIPSKFLKKALNIVVKAVELGTELASKALLAYSEQLRYEEEIIRALKEKMSEIRTMMMSMAVLVGPIVLGITIALQQVIIHSLMTYQPPQIPEELSLQMGISVPQMKGIQGNVASPLEFLVVVFIYNLLLTALLTYYAVSVYEGKNQPKLLLSLAKNLIISSILFVITTWLSVTLVRGMLG